ncbi:chromate transporter [Mycoplasmopsis cynos]|uniref:chromate transporter n=1 Tax=Mycoplasmopsis cynos TaxID=171284 RepID=UPI0022086493|nr:chromate transporter [Mycoplasmopsis cynos]UWV77138.1 chromate transporter [Mycoplasmopsis cynos]
MKIIFLYFKDFIHRLWWWKSLTPVIKKEIVENKKLLDVKEFDQIVIVTNMLPGASVIQCISYISIKLLGKVKGIIITLFALFFHILCLVLDYCFYFQKYLNNMYKYSQLVF